MLKNIQLKPHRAASANTYESTFEYPKESRRQNTAPVDMWPRPEGHRRRARHRNSNLPIEGGSIFSEEPVLPTVEELTSDRSCLVSGVPTLVFVRTSRSLPEY